MLIKKYSKEYINKLIDFMIIDRHLFKKTCKGKEDFYLPINEREKKKQPLLKLSHLY
ncbi:MAG: hypothetical protein L6V81_09145 [Clostridium sp.]|nr:MAG: hypothetical protein L6V81_09145 [Clostridium sp.]